MSGYARGATLLALGLALRWTGGYLTTSQMWPTGPNESMNSPLQGLGARLLFPGALVELGTVLAALGSAFLVIAFYLELRTQEERR